MIASPCHVTSKQGSQSKSQDEAGSVNTPTEIAQLLSRCRIIVGPGWTTFFFLFFSVLFYSSLGCGGDLLCEATFCDNRYCSNDNNASAHQNAMPQPMHRNQQPMAIPWNPMLYLVYRHHTHGYTQDTSMPTMHGRVHDMQHAELRAPTKFWKRAQHLSKIVLSTINSISFHSSNWPNDLWILHSKISTSAPFPKQKQKSLQINQSQNLFLYQNI